MDIDEEKAVCGNCKEWQGKRERCEDGKLVRVSASSRGNCGRHGKPKVHHGGCDYWQKWEKE